jgi:hypothetical protein
MDWGGATAKCPADGDNDNVWLPRCTSSSLVEKSRPRDEALLFVVVVVVVLVVAVRTGEIRQACFEQ